MNVETVHRITGPHLLLPKTGAAVWLQVDKEESWSSHKETIFKRTFFSPRSTLLWTDSLRLWNLDTYA